MSALRNSHIKSRGISGLQGCNGSVDLRSDEAKRKPQISLKDAKEVKLAAIPDGVKKTRPKSVGWVKEEPVKPKEEPTEKKRVLPQIPMGGGEKADVSTSTPAKGIKCGSCGTEIKFCPYCGKPLDKH